VPPTVLPAPVMEMPTGQLVIRLKPVMVLPSPETVKQAWDAPSTMTPASMPSTVSLSPLRSGNAEPRAMVPGLAFGVVPGGIRVVVGDVEAGDGLRVLLYARSKSGVWFGLHLVDAESARDTCTGGAEADMTLAGCVGSEW